MARKKAFVAQADRAAPPKPDQRVGELCVRDLETLLGHVLARKNLAAEVVPPKNWKIEKWEGSKLESFKSELGKFEHGEPKGGFEPGPDPRQLWSKIEELIGEISELKAEVAKLRGAARKGRSE